MRNSKIYFVIIFLIFAFFTTTIPFMVSAGADDTHVYILPDETDVDVGDTSFILIKAQTNQSINGWQFHTINFTNSVIGVNSVTISTFFADNGTSATGTGSIDNDTGVIGGSWVDYCYETAAGGCWQNNTNNTVINISYTGTHPGEGTISFYSPNSQPEFMMSGGEVLYTTHSIGYTIHPQTPQGFDVTADGTSAVDLDWTSTSGADTIFIRGKQGSYPSSRTDGSPVCNETASTGHYDWSTPNEGETWYFKAWSYNATENLYSVLNATYSITLGNDYFYVNNDADPTWYDANHVKTIQEGIDNATSGDTVFVYNGTYYENLVVNKTIDLIGEDRDGTIIDGGGSGDVINISADWVNISGFTVQNGGSSSSEAGIRVISGTGNNMITSNTVTNNHYGIYLDYSNSNTLTGNTVTLCNGGYAVYIVASNGNTISNNTISSNLASGIRFTHASKYNIISGNNITFNSGHGVYLRYANNRYNTITENNISYNGGSGIRMWADSSYNIIDNNTVSNNYYGIYLTYPHASGNLFINNTITSNNYDGVYLRCSGNTFSGNNITSNNRWGISIVEGSNTITGNNIISNNDYGIHFGYCNPNNNLIYNNNFINNIQNAYDKNSNFWDNGYPSGGNYWDDYTGTDNYHGPNQDMPGSDGIGDTPYNISGGSNQDNYPLMNPTNQNHGPIIYNPFPSNGAKNISTDGTPINFRIFDLDIDSLWNELWSNFTGEWIQYAGWNLEANPIHWCVVDHENDGDLDVFDLQNYNNSEGWVKSGFYGFYNNQSFTDNWGMNQTRTTYYWSVNVTDNTTWNNVTYHFSTFYPPLADFTYTPTYPARIDNIEFTDISIDDGNISKWYWEFGDEYGSNMQHPNHQYTELGTYLVNLTVWDDENNSNTTQQSITVINCPPIADFDYLPLSPQSNEEIEFTDISTDPDGYIISWYWDFGDGYISTLQNPSHTYTSDGIYSVTLKVTDNDSGVDTVAKVIPVSFQMMPISMVLTGWNFISAPYNFTQDTHEFFFKYGDYYYYYYNWTQATTTINPTDGPLINQYMFGWNRSLQTYTFERNLEPGYGYWMYAFQPCELWNQYDDIPEDDHITELQTGWNIVSIPCNLIIEKTDLLVDNVPWDTAVTNGWINTYVYGWNRAGQYYTFANTFNPGYSYWVYASQSCVLKRNV